MANMDAPTCSKTCKDRIKARSCRVDADAVNVCRVNVIEGEPNDRQMTTGNHTVRDIYCCKCKTILGWKYVSVLFAFYSALFPFCSRIPVLGLTNRTRRTSSPRSTRKGSTSSSATSSSTCNSRGDPSVAFSAPPSASGPYCTVLANFGILGNPTFLTSWASRFF